MPQEHGDARDKKERDEIESGGTRGIVTQMQLLSTRKEDGHQPLSTATQQQGNTRKIHKDNVSVLNPEAELMELAVYDAAR